MTEKTDAFEAPLLNAHLGKGADVVLETRSRSSVGKSPATTKTR